MPSMKTDAMMKWLSQSSNLYILFHQILFLLSGLVTTLGTQWIFYHGAATGDSYLTQLAQYVGSILVGMIIPVLLKNKKKGYDKISQEDDIHMVQIDTDIDHTPKEPYQEGPIHHFSVMKLAVLDVFANFCVTMGFSIIGSGMYQVIYSSVVIWCAILSYFIMGRSLSHLQWFAICGTSAGLAISSLHNFSSSSSSDENAKMSLLMVGTIMTLGGTFFYSCVYVYSDYLMSQYTPAPLPARICFYSGIYTSILSVIWISFYTLPRFDDLIHIKTGTSTELVISAFLMVTLASASHSWNYYELIDRTGNVATGILQGLRAVLIYVISDAWYCKSDSAQCFTMYKGIGSALVIGCVLLFTIGRQTTQKKQG